MVEIVAAAPQPEQERLKVWVEAVTGSGRRKRSTTILTKGSNTSSAAIEAPGDH